ncbi:MAG TPA: DUF29 domain-containing protein [Geminicoccaceae bacterium]
MAKVIERSPDDLYETDHYRWLEEQTVLLREGRLEDLDAVNLIEELEDLAGSERAAVESHAATVIEHLLKLEHSPAARPRRGWRLTVARDRGRLARRLTPRLRQHLERSLDGPFQDGSRAAAIGLEIDRVPAEALPRACPYTLEQILDRDWYPKNRHGLGDPGARDDDG